MQSIVLRIRTLHCNTLDALAINQNSVAVYCSMRRLDVLVVSTAGQEDHFDDCGFERFADTDKLGDNSCRCIAQIDPSVNERHVGSVVEYAQTREYSSVCDVGEIQ